MMFVLFAVVFFLATMLMAGAVSATISKSVSGLVSISVSSTVTDADGLIVKPTLPAAQPSTLTTRTNGTSGSLTMTNSGHGVTTGSRVDLYWAGGSCYGATVGTVSGTTVPIASVSGGTALPSTSTAIKVGKCVSSAFALTGDNLSALFGYCGSANGYFVFNDGASDLNPQYVVAGGLYEWSSSDGSTNPLVGQTPTVVFMSHSDTTASHTDMQAVAMMH